MIDKRRLRDAILRQLAADLDLQVRAAELARDEATSEESKAENKYDTRAQEAAYLAEGQARQAAELRDSLALYQTLEWPAATSAATVGSLLRLEAPGRPPAHYFLGPRAGGLEVRVDEVDVTVVTPSSPLGRQLLQAHVGHRVSLPGRPRPVDYTIAAIE